MLYTGKADIGVGNMYVSDLHDRMDFQHYSAPYAVEVRGGGRGGEGEVNGRGGRGMGRLMAEKGGGRGGGW